MPKVLETVADRYQITRVLGEGGFAAVFEANDLRASGEVAVKVLDPSKSHDPSFAKRFEQEVTLVRKLSHHNSVKISDMGRTETGCLFMVMEVVKGQPLDDLLEQSGGLSPERVVRITSQVLKSLGEAHAHGIVHRDLKPANIMVSQQIGEPDYVKVLDFGIAKAVGGDGGMVKTQTGMVLCTPTYASPELLRSQGVVPATDLYSLGLMMVEMITGAPAVQADSLADVIALQMTPQNLPLPAELTGHPLRAVVERATQKDLGRRYQDANQMLTDLGEALRAGVDPYATTAPTHGSSPSPAQPLPDALHPGRGGVSPVLVAAVGLLVVVCSGVMIWALSQGQANDGPAVVEVSEVEPDADEPDLVPQIPDDNEGRQAGADAGRVWPPEPLIPPPTENPDDNPVSGDENGTETVDNEMFAALLAADSEPDTAMLGGLAESAGAGEAYGQGMGRLGEHNLGMVTGAGVGGGGAEPEPMAAASAPAAVPTIAREPEIRVRVGDTEVMGALSRDIIRRVMRRHRRGFQHCYERELQADPSLAGRVSVRFTIDPTGSVQSAQVQECTLDNSAVESCVVGQVRRMQFPAPDGGGIVVVTNAWVFSRE